MSDQLHLFRKTDPLSSRAAACRAAQFHGAQCAAVLKALRLQPGSTSRELAQRMCMDRYMVARRLPDLRKKGAVKQGPQRVCEVAGHRAVTWEVTP